MKMNKCKEDDYSNDSSHDNPSWLLLLGFRIISCLILHFNRVLSGTQPGTGDGVGGDSGAVVLGSFLNSFELVH